jgi:hypothetical protein
MEINRKISYKLAGQALQKYLILIKNYQIGCI